MLTCYKVERFVVRTVTIMFDLYRVGSGSKALRGTFQFKTACCCNIVNRYLCACGMSIDRDFHPRWRHLSDHRRFLPGIYVNYCIEVQIGGLPQGELVGSCWYLPPGWCSVNSLYIIDDYSCIGRVRLYVD